jgi:hypothetical protein
MDGVPNKAWMVEMAPPQSYWDKKMNVPKTRTHHRTMKVDSLHGRNAKYVMILVDLLKVEEVVHRYQCY